jgi:hypothetical protein
MLFSRSPFGGNVKPAAREGAGSTITNFVDSAIRLQVALAHGLGPGPSLLTESTDMVQILTTIDWLIASKSLRFSNPIP